MTNLEKLTQYIDQYLDGIYDQSELAGFVYDIFLLRLSADEIAELNARLKVPYCELPIEVQTIEVPYGMLEDEQ